jgi:hypothetical protein
MRGGVIEEVRMGGPGSGNPAGNRKPVEHKEFEDARSRVARELALADRRGIDILCDKADIRTVLFGMVAIQAENAALKHDLGRAMKRENQLLNAASPAANVDGE